jgi:hypothetical protein
MKKLGMRVVVGSIQDSGELEESIANELDGVRVKQF